MFYIYTGYTIHLKIGNPKIDVFFASINYNISNNRYAVCTVT